MRTRGARSYLRSYHVLTEGDYLLLSFFSTHFCSTTTPRENEVQNPKSHKLISFL